jgi:hypothetical protein
MARRIRTRPGVASFWRCGARHTAEGAAFPDSAFSAHEWRRLEAEPMLIVEPAEEPAGDGGKPAEEPAADAGKPPAPPARRRSRTKSPKG